MGLDTKTDWPTEILGRINRLLSLIRHGPHWKRRVQHFFYCFVCFVSAVTFLPSRCLAMIGGFLPSRCLATIKVFLLSRRVATIGGIHRHTHTQTATWFHKPTLIFQNNKTRLIELGLWDHLAVCVSICAFIRLCLSICLCISPYFLGLWNHLAVMFVCLSMYPA
jgi:hypothetical protein